MKSKFKLTKQGKMVAFILLVIALGALVFGAFKSGFVKPNQKSEKPKNEVTATDDKTSEKQNETTTSSKSNKMRISLDEWIGWKSILDANGGLTTQPGSIFDELGLDLEVSIINDGSQSSTAMIKGDLDGAGYTVNRYAFLYDKFLQNNVEVSMPFITNFSTGGDGIIVKDTINKVEDLVGKKVGVPRFSEAQTLVVWLVENSDLSDADKQSIIDNLILFDTPDDAAKAFFAGELDAAGTWQPYLSQAQETTGCKLLFSTKSAHNLILDGIVFRDDYIEQNRENVEKFIKGILMAQPMYDTEFKAIKNSMSLFATETNENIKAMTADGQLATYNDNDELLNGLAQQVFVDMSNIWTGLGETAHADKAEDAFDSTVMKVHKDEFSKVETKVPGFTEEQREESQNIDALLKKSCTINFQPNSAVFANQEEATKTLNEFVKIAKIVNGSIIQIEGNIASDKDDESGIALSHQRAKTISEYFKSQGVDPSRFVIIGNGGTKPVAPNNSEENMAKNRRTDIMFKVIE